MAVPAVITVNGLGKRYRLGSDAASYGRLTESIVHGVQRSLGRLRNDSVEESHVWALRDVSFDVAAGDIVGVVGRNGAGKTTLLKLLSRITDPTEGRAELRGRVGSLLEVGTGFHPELSGRENVFLNGSILGMTRNEIRSKFDDIVSFAELDRFIDTPVKRYSSGMYVRLAFSVAAFLEPEILFIDEVLSVGDQAFQRRCIGRIGEIANSGRTIFFVSHNLAAVSALCTRALLLERGRLVADGEVGSIIDTYLRSVQASTGEQLEHRDDRQGDGRLRIVHAELLDEQGGPPRTGVDAVLRLAYRSTAPDADVGVSIGVEGPLGEPVFSLSNRITGDSLRSAAASGEITCALRSLPLLPGRYSLTIYVEVGGVVADWVRNAFYFDVFEADVYGTGKLPPTTHGRVLVDGTWAVVTPVRADVAT
jgi:lipopolysaccharide transport system ATP-binding protein